ncbi:uncharacterized protein LOC144148339 [Haemaphysalis longicornis]
MAHGESLPRPTAVRQVPQKACHYHVRARRLKQKRSDLYARANVTHCANVVVLRASVEANEVSEVLNRFWDFESIGVKCEDERSSENDLVITKFEETIKKTNERYEVALPWKPRVDLADNLAVAAKRLHILMKKLGKDASLMERYDATIRTYLEEGSAERVPPTENVPRGRLYYMPHRAVIREDRSTTKVRIVFDASSHENGAKSLNENLEAGPNLNPDVVTLLLRFRRENNCPGKGALSSVRDDESSRDTDTFSFKNNILLHFIQQHEVTKRFVLQAIARVYDPLGFLSPFLIKAKILLQDIWRENLDWEDPLPYRLRSIWPKWAEEVALLHDVVIPRFLGAGRDGQNRTSNLHVFADASESAYGAVVYLTIHDASGSARTVLLFAKTRVAPLKTVTLARLELMSAIIAARIYSYITKNCELDIEEVTFWSDSQIALCWIRKDPSTWKTFVRNRVQEIRNLTDYTRWRFCPGRENPADLLKRGISADLLKRSHLWWHGPDWLTDPDLWPEIIPEGGQLDAPEQVATTGAHAVNTTILVPPVIDTERFSSLSKLLRVTAWVLRYVKNLKQEDKVTGPLTTEEVQNAEHYLIRVEQQLHFDVEVKCIATKKPLPSHSKIKELRLLVDDDGLLRVRGRVLASDTYGAQVPILLPKDTHFTHLMIQHAHVQVLHGGVRDTLTQVRRGSGFHAPDN